MPLFTSSREKNYWLYSLIVLIAILSTLVFGRPFQEMLRDQNVQAIFFSLGLILTIITVAIHSLKTRPVKTELVIWLGFAAVYIMLAFRLGAPERSHLIEYSVLAIFIHKAFIERLGHNSHNMTPALFAFLITVILGVLDETVQFFLPNRVYDPVDMLFNSLAAFLAIGTSMTLQWVRKKFRK